MLSLIYFIFSINFINTNNNNCMNITNHYNTSFHESCYQHIIESNEKCCHYFLLDEKCQKDYLDCVNFEDYVLNKIIDSCHNNNKTFIDINYTETCHHFALHLNPNCCSNYLIGNV